MANEWMNYVDDDEEWLRKQLEQRRQQLFAPRHRDPRRETPTPAPYTPSPTMDLPGGGLLPIILLREMLKTWQARYRTCLMARILRRQARYRVGCLLLPV